MMSTCAKYVFVTVQNTQLSMSEVVQQLIDAVQVVGEPTCTRQLASGSRGGLAAFEPRFVQVLRISTGRPAGICTHNQVDLRSLRETPVGSGAAARL